MNNNNNDKHIMIITSTITNAVHVCPSDATSRTEQLATPPACSLFNAQGTLGFDARHAKAAPHACYIMLYYGIQFIS